MGHFYSNKCVVRLFGNRTLERFLYRGFGKVKHLLVLGILSVVWDLLLVAVEDGDYTFDQFYSNLAL